MNDFLNIIFPLILTIAAEYIIVQAMEKEKNVIMQVLIVNIVTNPAINLFYRYVLVKNIVDNTKILLIVTGLEIIIWIIEGIMYKFLLKTNWKTAFKYSIISEDSYICIFLS